MRVLKCSGSGSASGVIAGINWVTGDHGAGETGMANMSLSSPTTARASTCSPPAPPAESIISAWYTSDAATATLSGTSMASPHVAGVAALYLQGAPTASPAAVADAITS